MISKETTIPQELSVLLSTFAPLFVVELGDKTQLAVIRMTARHKMPLWIFAGATLALTAVILLGVLGRALLTRFIPKMILCKIAAVLFVCMGLSMWFDKFWTLQSMRRLPWSTLPPTQPRGHLETLLRTPQTGL